MKVRRVLVGLVVLAGLAWSIPAEAQQCCSWIQTFCHNVARDWKRNNCWPEAFVPADRLSVRAPFVVMVNNGWRRQNLLADHHFAEETADLNEAGKLKVHWIMTQAPKQHRTIYVHQSRKPEETAARIASVQEYAVEFAEQGQFPNVLATHLDPAGLPAARVDMIDRRWLESSPDPRLPEGDGGGDSGD
jgi:hypothetical protein